MVNTRDAVDVRLILVVRGVQQVMEHVRKLRIWTRRARTRTIEKTDAIVVCVKYLKRARSVLHLTRYAYGLEVSANRNERTVQHVMVRCVQEKSLARKQI